MSDSSSSQSSVVTLNTSGFPNLDTIVLATDHGGFEIKEELKSWLPTVLPVQVSLIDVGAEQLNPDDDYPLFAIAAAQKIQATGVSDSAQTISAPIIGIFLCRTGGGMAMVANRFAGVRAIVCRDQADVTHARAHNQANVLVLEGDRLTTQQSQELVKCFLSTKFSGGRHIRRIAEFDRLGEK